VRRSSALDVSDVPSKPSMTKPARRSSVHDVSDVPAQPSMTRQSRRSSALDVSDVPMKPSATRQARRSSALGVADIPLKPSITKAPTLADITRQRARILGNRPADDAFTPLLQVRGRLVSRYCSLGRDD